MRRLTKQKEAGRQIPCSLCPATTVQGSAQVYRKLLFFFCPPCWLNRRAECNSFMRRVADPAQKAAA
jgi:hypothetical protein